ncbi:FAD-binding protein [Lactobacillus delbrueckii]|uniref:FAD-binding protein n=1 Tax=Lactobacillus delbrueckii TaxID=1584 RepID=UPI0020D1165F|nr:FAD-binding protein [Lactobacillus delbrueckii]
MKINAQCNVIDNFGQPIPGLYAAGMNAGGWIGSYDPTTQARARRYLGLSTKAAEQLSRFLA